MRNSFWNKSRVNRETHIALLSEPSGLCTSDNPPKPPFCIFTQQQQQQCTQNKIPSHMGLKARRVQWCEQSRQHWSASERGMSASSLAQESCLEGIWGAARLTKFFKKLRRWLIRAIDWVNSNIEVGWSQTIDLHEQERLESLMALFQFEFALVTVRVTQSDSSMESAPGFGLFTFRTPQFERAARQELRLLYMYIPRDGTCELVGAPDKLTSSDLHFVIYRYTCDELDENWVDRR